ncbi:hypothetical protein [Trichoplusia ni ascovirus 6b]|nr:hypothetical protein [Trichoplusia ni ascovirus 6b]
MSERDVNYNNVKYKRPTMMDLMKRYYNDAIKPLINVLKSFRLQTSLKACNCYPPTIVETKTT